MCLIVNFLLLYFFLFLYEQTHWFSLLSCKILTLLLNFKVEICGTSWTYNPALLTKVASGTDSPSIGASAGGEILIVIIIVIIVINL